MTDNTKMKYTQDKADEICELIVDGHTIRDICAFEHLPSVKTFFKWLRDHDEFGKQYAHAKEEQAEIMVQEMFSIADDGQNDWYDKQLKNGETVRALDHEHVQRSKLRIDTRKWAASKFKPKKYGERIVHAGDEDAPLTTKDVSETDRAALSRFLQNHPDRVKDLPPVEIEEKDGEHDDLC